MVLELRDKLPPAGAPEARVSPAISPTEEDVLSALVNLGYQRPVAEKAVASLGKNGSDRSFETMFREALAALAK